VLRPVVDDPLGQHLADARQGHQLGGGSGIDVDQRRMITVRLGFDRFRIFCRRFFRLDLKSA
jgi:hypothetical protein